MPTLPAVSPMVELRYAQVEELIAGLLDVDAERAEALTARLRLFRQRGFPPGLGNGSKRVFIYDLDAVLKLCLAFCLMDALVPQEAIPSFIEGHWEKLRRAFASSFTMMRDLGDEQAMESDDRRMLVLAAQGLQSFRVPKNVSAPLIKGEILHAGPLALDASWRARHREFAPMIVIDLLEIATWVQKAILSARWGERLQFDDYAAAYP